MNLSRRAWVLTTLMVATAAASATLRPRHRLADHLPRLDLEATVPKAFAGWRVDPRVLPVTVSPDVQAKLDEIYNQTLLRTYVNEHGQQVMLSIAYGADQSGDRTQVHRPEFCYSAQGFRLESATDGQLQLNGRSIPVRRLVASHAVRREPITYWVTVGSQSTLPGLNRKLLQLRYGVAGEIPDGLLFRVSSLGDDRAEAFAMHERFAAALLHALKPGVASRIAGIQFD